MILFPIIILRTLAACKIGVKIRRDRIPMKKLVLFGGVGEGISVRNKYNIDKNEHKICNIILFREKNYRR